MQSEQINELAVALAKAQGTMKNAAMDKVNPHFRSRYASLASVLDAIRDPLSANGLSITSQRKGDTLYTTLWHDSGQWLRTEYPLPAVERPQEMGSILTYAKRYSISGLVCNASDEDDDANAADAAVKKQNGRTGASNEIINPAQVENLETFLADFTPARRKKFLDYIGASDVKLILAKNYVEACRTLAKAIEEKTT